MLTRLLPGRRSQGRALARANGRSRLAIRDLYCRRTIDREGFPQAVVNLPAGEYGVWDEDPFSAIRLRR